MSTIVQIAKNNGCSPQIILQMNNNFVHKIYHGKQTVRPERTEKWITLTLHSPLVRKVTNLLEQTNLQIAFKTANTLFDMLKPKTIMHYKYVCRGVYKLT
jgi:exonuclease V gamma subunit